MEPKAKTAPTIDATYQRDWPAYFDAVQGLPPRETLTKALDELWRSEFVAPTGVDALAIDIGCGEGRDSREILRRLPSVTLLATDASDHGLARTKASVPPDDARRTKFEVCTMERLPRQFAGLGSETPVILINASFALPFCEPDAFPALWAWIWATLTPGGCFAGQLFGDRDEWATIDPRRHHSRASVEALLAGRETLWLDEAEKVGPDAMGGTKHHHVFHVVARKPGRG
ncbi:MAG: class I SAM-dependent methyltransferase [Phycisphaerales bacterium]|jgi:hypothetical protein